MVSSSSSVPHKAADTQNDSAAGGVSKPAPPAYSPYSEGEPRQPPLTAYFIWMCDNRAAILQLYRGDYTGRYDCRGGWTKKAGALWRALEYEKKRKYKLRAARAMADYAAKVEAYFGARERSGTGSETSGR